MYADLILDKCARKLCLTNLALVLHLIAGEKWKSIGTKLNVYTEEFDQQNNVVC